MPGGRRMGNGAWYFTKERRLPGREYMFAGDLN